MRNLEKLFWVACAVFFFTSCEETYNDKLFWPGEISQEYGSYIKPYTIDLTYLLMVSNFMRMKKRVTTRSVELISRWGELR